MKPETQQKLMKSKKIDKIYMGKIVNLKLETLSFNNTEITKEIVEHIGSVGMLPVMATGEIILVRQYRRPLDTITLEIPAGLLDKNESVEECAQRELQEEIGYLAKKLTPLGIFFLSPGFCDEKISLFLAEDLKKSSLTSDDDEVIDVVPLTSKEVLSKIKNNEIKDAKTLAAIMHYLLLIQ